MRIRKSAILTGLVTITCLTSNTFAAPADNTIYLSTPFGEKTALDWQWEAVSGDSGSASGGGAAQANFSAVTLTRTTDSWSPIFLELLATGDFLPEITLRQASILMVLRKVSITSYATNASSGRSGERTESMAVEFAEFEYRVDGEVTCFDLEQNVVC